MQSVFSHPDLGIGLTALPCSISQYKCIYCYARPTHEYLGFSAGLDFETKILAKMDAPVLLRKELSSPRWKPEVIAMISVTTLDDKLRRILEPRASHPEHRIKAIQTLNEADIPVGVIVAPIIAGLNDAEIPAIVKAAVQAGARRAGYTHLRLPYGVASLFEQWLEEHVPTKKDKVLNRVRAMRGGQLNESQFGNACGARGYLPSKSRRCLNSPAARLVSPTRHQRFRPMPSATDRVAVDLV